MLLRMRWSPWKAVVIIGACPWAHVRRVPAGQGWRNSPWHKFYRCVFSVLEAIVVDNANVAALMVTHMKDFLPWLTPDVGATTCLNAMLQVRQPC